MTDSTKPGKQGTHEAEVLLRRTVQDAGTLNALQAVAFGNQLFVAVGPGGLILTSHDGSLWRLGCADVTEDLHCVNFGNGVFVAAGGRQTILISDDGENWARRSN